MATGMWKPNVPPMKGLDLAEGYEHINLDPSHYEGKTVLILGEFIGVEFSKCRTVYAMK